MTTPLPHLSHPKYRPDIDGLRAVAVLAVVTFHAFPDWMKGGFIGVDIFFVISGFLISTIIFDGLDKGAFSFSEFYSRRIKRIFPALSLVLIASYAFGWFTLLSDEYMQLGKHIAAGSGFVANFVFWSEAGYFDNSGETKPLLHLWSLGIEEQFYIVWPLVLWFSWRRKLNLLTLSATAALISFYLNIKGVKQDSVATFYSPQTRFWELLCGSILAWLTLYRKNALASIKLKIDGWLAKAIYREDIETDGKTISNTISIIGCLLLIYGFSRISKSMSFPGNWAVAPVLGAVLLISSGPKAWINKKILSNKLAIWLGLISFPLYLWHWPLLSFSRIIESEVPSRKIRFAALALSILLAWLTYKFIERPIRLGKNSKAKVAGLVMLVAIVGYAGYNTYSRGGLGFRNIEKDAIPNRFDYPYKESCKKFTGESYYDDWCNIGTKSQGEISTALIGDSFSNAYSTMLNSYSNSIDLTFSFTQLGRGQCPSLLDYGPAYCKLITEKSLSYIRNSPKIKTVVLASNWPAYYNGKDFNWIKHIENKDAFTVAFEKTVKTYINLGKQVVVFLSPPVGSNPKSCITRPIRITNKNICKLSTSDALNNDGNYRDYMIPLLDSLGVQHFDPFKYFCNEVECKIMADGKIFSADGGHMSVFGGEFLSIKGSDELRKLLSH